MTTELRDANQDFTRLIRAASHDIAEPLQLVLSYAELLAARSAGRLDETGERYLAGINTGARRIRELLDGLLAYSRLERESPHPAQVDCSEVVWDLFEVLEDSLVESGATVRVEALPTITADPLDLRRLLGNLLENALKFRREDPPEIDIRATQEEEVWHFRVRDNGIGIEPDRREEVFEIFGRLNPRARYPGAGIGLAICKKVVERWRGQIWVDSGNGTGSTFHFTIPV